MLLAGVVIFRLLRNFKIQYSQKDCMSDAGLGFFINLQLYQKTHPGQELGLSTVHKSNNDKHAAN